MYFKRNEASITSYLAKVVTSIALTASIVSSVNATDTNIKNSINDSLNKNPIIKVDNGYVKTTKISYKDAIASLRDIGDLNSIIDQAQKLDKENPGLLKKVSVADMENIRKESMDKYIENVSKHNPDFIETLKKQGINDFFHPDALYICGLDSKCDEILKDFIPQTGYDVPSSISIINGKPTNYSYFDTTIEKEQEKELTFNDLM